MTDRRVKITDDDVRAIRRAYDQGVPQIELCRRYGLAPSTVSAIVHRFARRNVTD